MKILVLGITGMLGNTMFRALSETPNYEVYGSARSELAKHHFDGNLSQQIICGVDAENHDSLLRVWNITKPDVVINCIGLVKQLANAEEPLHAIPINSILPHRLAALCYETGARLVQISTDCVFSGAKGNYCETDFPDAHDLYGRSKLLGEVDYPYAITLRTSIIGHELAENRSLIGWFLAQRISVKGYTRAVFSGLPTVELFNVVRDAVLPNPELRGLYHVAALPISKYDLLKLVADIYGKNIEIVPDDKIVIDRSLNANRFRLATGYIAPPWNELINRMYEFN
ncbi:dTDP-4-dehydrorhamnose reductase family protein [Candidatus Methylopumilus planktonicus]|uniref:dTDP-4-dehydrorhamnose reductase family protein n=1 Tax=Candidatus Methylopumilus planktonicus TaxID=1581557 RepID=UPI003BEF08E4